MAAREILLFGSPVLRIQAKAVEVINDAVRALVDDMIDTMEEAEGIGLAAPQIGESLALCVVNNGLIEEGSEPRAYINPVIYEEMGSEVMEEGCLSIPDIREEISRPETIRLKYLDIEGAEHDELCSAMLARVLQHEIDHLNGILFVDHLSTIKRKLLDKRLKKIAAER